jgi:hypothetical protein
MIVEWAWTEGRFRSVSDMRSNSGRRPNKELE